jgi:hypothetical protein
LQKQEKIYLSVKDYENAELVKQVREDLEMKEFHAIKRDLQIKLMKEEAILKQK